MYLVDFIAIAILIITLILFVGLIIISATRAAVKCLSKVFWIMIGVLTLLMVIGVGLRLHDVDPLIIGNPHKEAVGKYIYYAE